MEELHELLVNYNSYNIKEKYQRSWSKQFCEPTFPIYWQKVFDDPDVYRNPYRMWIR